MRIVLLCKGVPYLQKAGVHLVSNRILEYLKSVGLLSDCHQLVCWLLSWFPRICFSSFVSLLVGLTKGSYAVEVQHRTDSVMLAKDYSISKCKLITQALQWHDTTNEMFCISPAVVLVVPGTWSHQLCCQHLPFLGQSQTCLQPSVFQEAGMLDFSDDMLNTCCHTCD